MELTPVMKLTKDLKDATKTLGADEARFLVDAYYMMQKDRIRTGNQVKQLSKGNEPHSVLAWFGANADNLESSIQRALDAYSLAHPVGKWSQSICGIGPVIAAGLLAHIDINLSPTVGHIWSFAGLNPEAVWEKGQKRPWNASLKTLCWKIGESFVKVSSNKNDHYGKVWLQRKEWEAERNRQGLYADAARKYAVTAKEHKQARFYQGDYNPALVYAYIEENGGRAPNSLVAKEWKLFEEYVTRMPGVPMLPPGHIHARAKRYAVKLFLSHWHWVAYEVEFGKKPPLPYVIEHLGHADLLAPPNWPTKQ